MPAAGAPAYDHDPAAAAWRLGSNFSRLVWRPAVQQLSLDGLRFHDPRHTAATLLLPLERPPGN